MSNRRQMELKWNGIVQQISYQYSTND